MISGYTPGLRLQDDLGPFVNRPNRTLFEDVNTCGFCRACEPKRQVQRMQMGSTHIQNPAPIVRRRAKLVQTLTAQGLNLVIAIAVIQEFSIAVQVAHVSGPRCGPSNTMF